MLLTYGAGCAGAGLTTFNDQGAFPYRQAACEGSTPFDKFCSRTKASVAVSDTPLRVRLVKLKGERQEESVFFICKRPTFE